MAVGPENCCLSYIRVQNTFLEITKNVKNALRQINFIQQNSTYDNGQLCEKECPDVSHRLKF